MRIRLDKSNEAVDSLKHKYQLDLYNFGSLFNNDVDNDDIESVRSAGSNEKKRSICFYLLHYINSKVFMQALAERTQSTFDNVKHVEL
jgi:hypothetical protein